MSSTSKKDASESAVEAPKSDRSEAKSKRPEILSLEEQRRLTDQKKARFEKENNDLTPISVSGPSSAPCAALQFVSESGSLSSTFCSS
ncbi:hypothetical protein L596_011528 [Steinernema carpocapsae]|uniref:Uncharacterized protein n=1 Tax=Steinernema carpocapsae TaxID=34508 RepID=A0A4U5NU65_STECR|nr:hypothetical protein L596_011528 [Steinernema carpocapsae]